MGEKTIYIKPELNTMVTHTKITIADISPVYSYDSKLAKEIGALEICKVPKEKKQKITVSIMKLVRLIADYRADITVINLGEKDFIIEYSPAEKQKKLLEIAKTIAVSLIVFAGSAFTIMTFNEDASVRDVFQMLYDMVPGKPEPGSGFLEVSYSIGLPLGIILFFNHFSTAKMNSDPTPLQVQMRLYEQNTDTTIIENASREGKKQE